jgi:hypothetical protein
VCCVKVLGDFAPKMGVDLRGAQAAAAGSVVDAVDEQSCARIVIPRLGEKDERRLGDAGRSAHQGWVRAAELEATATALLQARIANGYERSA